MTLKELHILPIREVIEDMDISSLKIFTDDDGNVIGIEIKYIPVDNKKEVEKKGFRK